MEIVNIPIDKIKPDPSQPRKTFDKESLEDLAQDIKNQGLINPIEIDDKYILITGERRWRAARLAGLKVIPAKILNLTPEEKFRRQISENVQRSDMTAWDTAQSVKRVYDMVRKTHIDKKTGDKAITETAKILGKSSHYIDQYLKVIGSSKDLQTMVKNEEMTVALLEALNRIPEQHQEAIKRKILAGELTNRDTLRELAYALKKDPSQAQNLLNLDFSKFQTAQEALVSISYYVPRMAQLVKKSYQPPEELTDIKNALVQWLKNNPKKIIGKIHGPRILLTLSVMQEAINAYVGNSDNDKYRSLGDGQR